MIVVGIGQDLRSAREHFQIDERVAVGLGATKLFREAAVARDLVRDQNRFEALAAEVFAADPFNELQPPVSETHRYQDLKQCAANIHRVSRQAIPTGSG
jgi:hypothetical protein